MPPQHHDALAMLRRYVIRNKARIDARPTDPSARRPANSTGRAPSGPDVVVSAADHALRRWPIGGDRTQPALVADDRERGCGRAPDRDQRGVDLSRQCVGPTVDV